jgi:hypothetical protein
VALLQQLPLSDARMSASLKELMRASAGNLY